MSDILSTIGITQEELQQRVVDKIVAQVMTTEITDDETGLPYTAVAEAMNAHVRSAVNAKVAELAEKFVVPQVETLIENFTMQTTNKWGEKTGQPTTFIEYLTQRAEAYLTEPVDYEGKTVERGSYGKATQARIAHLIEKHLHYNISNAITAALKDLNSKIADGLAKTVQLKLAEALAGLTVKTEVKR